MLAMIAGRGRLPVILAETLEQAGRPLRIATLDGIGSDLPDRMVWRSFRVEHLGSLLGDLRREGFTEVCFAGSITRPVLDPSLIDEATKPLLERLLATLSSGDDGALRAVVSIFEDHGLTVRSAAELRPDLLAEPGFCAGPRPSGPALENLPRACAILQALAAQDVGQSVVVGQRQCLGIETIQGTDALLEFVEHSDQRHKRGQDGVLVKGPKPGQDLRIDMPAIGPATVQRAARAGLAGIVVQAGKTLILDRDALIKETGATGIFVNSRELGL